MKTAYLISCHKDMQYVSRLAHQIYSEDSHIFIHVDMNVSDEAYKSLRSSTSDLEHCYFSEVRKHGILDDRSLVDIVMMLVAYAKESAQQNGIHYSYFVAMSGQDYPIKPIHFVEKTLEKNYPDLYLDCKDSVNTGWVSRKFNRNRALIHYRNSVLKCKYSVIRKALQGIGVLLRYVLYLFGQTAKQRIEKKGWKIYGGSAWWILPDCVIDAVEKDYNAQTEIAVMLLDESTTPEETFFQSMVMHIFYPDGIENSNLKMKIQDFKTYVDFGFESSRPITCHPYIITVEDYDRLRSSEKWLARKFDNSIDAVILDKIDETLLK